MTTLKEVSGDPFASSSPLDRALEAEGVTGKRADIARSIYAQESSSGKNTKTSNAGAVGGMQIIPATFNRMADKGWSINDPDHNARAGVRYINQLADKAGDDPALVAAGYYGGEGAIDKARKGIAVSDPRNPKAPTTLEYGKQVASRVPANTSVKLREVDGDPFAQSAPSTPTVAPKKEMTVGEDIMTGVRDIPRQFGLTARYGIEGVGNSLDFLASPIRGALNLAGANIKSGGGETLANTLGLPKPQTPTERVVGDVSRYMAGSAVPLGAAEKVAHTATGTTKVVANQLAARPVSQVASAGASGGADAITGEMGGSDTARSAAALAAGIATPLAIGRSSPNALARPINAAQEAGYSMPPSQARPTLTNQILEGTSGKLSTAQKFSAKNQANTNKIVAQEIGLPPDTPISPESLSAVRKQAGEAYEALASLPVKAPVKGDSMTNRPAVAGFNPKEALYDLRVARSDADGWYSAYGRSARPDDLEKAKAAKSLATKLENQFEDYAAELGRTDLLPKLREARTLIAKTHTVESAMNPETGTIDASKLAKLLDKGKPLTGGLKQAAQFASRFPKAAQTPEKMGSLPGFSPLDVSGATLASVLTGNPYMMAGIAARPAARAISMSPLVQNRLGRPITQRNANSLMFPTAAIANGQNDD